MSTSIGSSLESEPYKPTVAIVGASNDPEKFGHKAVLAYLKQGWDVYPVNPNGGEIAGVASYASLRDLPVRPIKRVTMYVPPQVGIKLLDDIASTGCDELYLNPGSESDELVAAANAHGLQTILGCSIVDIGVNPHKI